MNNISLKHKSHVRTLLAENDDNDTFGKSQAVELRFKEDNMKIANARYCINGKNYFLICRETFRDL